MHPNSLQAFHELKTDKRKKLILEVLASNPIGLTDREIMGKLGFHDMNLVRPRITELIDLQIVDECGSIRDADTRKRVRIVRLRGADPLFDRSELTCSLQQNL